MRLHTFNHARPELTPYGFTCELWQAAAMNRPDRHDEIELNLLLRGSLTYLLGGNRVTLQAGSFGAFWAALPHQIIGFDGHPRYYVMTLPLAWFLQCQLPPKLVVRLLRGEFIIEPQQERMALDLALCRQWASELSGAGEPPSQATALEIHARLLRFAVALPDLPADKAFSRGKSGQGNTSKAEQMAGYIARHYRERLNVETVARVVDLHANYAMSLFKKTFRCTLNDYLTHYRTAHAQRLLATSDMKVLDIALESGFRTSSRFYEAFQRACGCSPKRYRQEHQIII